MRILYPARIDSYWPIGTIFREVGKRLPYDVTAFASEQSTDIDMGNITTISIGETKPERAWSYIKTNLTSSSYDLVHTGPIGSNILVGLGQLRAPSTHIHTVHNSNWGINRGLYPYILRQSLVSLCDRVTAVSSYVAAVVFRNAWKGRELEVIPNGVDIELFNPKLTETITNRVLYVGRQSTQKHPEMVRKISQELPKYRFRAIVSGLEPGDELYNELQQQNNVKLLPHQSHPELATEYSAAETFIAPYEQEGFGMTVLEALASGTPVVGYSSGNLPALLNHNGGKLVGNLSAPKWANKIKQMKSGLAEQSARRYAEGYSWDKISSKYAKLYSRADSMSS